MMPDDSSELAQIRGILESLLRIETYRELDVDFKKNPKLRKLFDLTGRATHSEIQKRLHLSPNIITETWGSWQDKGLVKKVGKSYQKTWRE
jgi:hypothetical protein